MPTHPGSSLGDFGPITFSWPHGIVCVNERKEAHLPSGAPRRKGMLILSSWKNN